MPTLSCGDLGMKFGTEKALYMRLFRAQSWQDIFGKFRTYLKETLKQ